MKHGTHNAYRAGCRCDDCRRGHAVYCWEKRQERMRRLRSGQVGRLPHGTKSTYTNWGCRCEPCTQANTATIREYRTRGGAA